MKVCTKCNKSYLDDAKFCEVCVASLDLVQEESEAKPKPTKIKPKRLGPKIGAVKKSDAPRKQMAKPLKRAEPFVSSTTVFQSDNDTVLGGTLLVAEPKTAEPEPVVEPEVAVAEPKTAEPEPVVEPEVAVAEPKTAEPEPVVEPEVAVAEPKTAEPEPVVEPEVAVEEPKTAEPEPVVEPEVAVAESKTADPGPVVEPEVAVAEPKTAEPEPVVEPEVADAEPKTAEPEPVVEPEVAVAEPKTAEPEPVVEPEVAVAEPKTAEPEPVVEPEVAVAEPKTAEPEPVVEPEVAVAEPNTAEPESIVEPEVAVEEPKTAEPEQNRRQNKKKGISLPLIIAVVGLLALIGVGAFFLFGEKTATFINCQENVSFVKEGGLYNLKVETDGDFEVAEDIEWISVSVADGRVSIECDPNNNGVYRSAILHLVSGELSESVEICQKGSATYINLSPEKLEFSSKGGEVTVEIDSDGSGFSIVGQECEITNKSERGFTVSVSSHSGAPREGKITVTSGNVSKELLFYQKGVCGRCGGTGKVVCSACAGTGKNQSWFSYGDPCSACSRLGKVACMACGGTGEK